MKTQTLLLRRTALAAAVTLVIGGVASLDVPTGAGTGMSSFISSAYAGDGNSGGGQKGAMGESRGGQGGQGAKGAGGQGQRGGKSVADVLADDDGDDDSDRPDWAGVPGGEGRPGGGGNTDSGTTKGDVYGDMIVVVRDPVTGWPLDVNGVPTAEQEEMLVCTDSNCTYDDNESWVEKTDDGEIPAGVTPIEVDLGRGSLVRAPSGVIDRRLDEALSLIESRDEGTGIEQDEAGRIVVTIDGVEKTIDSPLENLALYIDLLKGLTEGGSATVDALGSLATLDTATSLLAGMADKTGDISLDYLMYENFIAEVRADFTGFTYDRTYPTDYTFWYSSDGVVAPIEKTMDINEYLASVNGTLPADGEFAALFAAAADDAVEVIELIHTQIVTNDFLESNGFDPDNL